MEDEKKYITDSVKLEVEIYPLDGGGFGAYLSDNMGGSGIEVEANTPEDAASSLGQYIADYYYEQDEEEDENEEDS